MKKYSLRVSFNFEKVSDVDAERIAQIIIQNLPKVEGLSVKDVSLFNATDKKQLPNIK